MHLITEDDKAPQINVPLNLEYNFDYARFNEPSLQSAAKTTLGNFFGFVRQSFDGLLGVGQSLQNFYFDCLSKCPDGKKVFDEWLKSDDWGSSRYLATSAMSIWGWFEKLSPKIQRLVRQNVQKWSVSALRQLTKVSTDLIKELVRTGKKTAQQVKKSVGGGERESVGVSVKETREVENRESTLTSSHSDTSPLSHPATSKQEYFTAAEVEEKIAQALAQRDREKAEEEQGRFIEIRDAALEAAKRELIAAEQHAQKMTQAKQALIEQLAAKEEELQSVRALQIENQKLEQRVAELEQALQGASANNWDNTFNAQAAKVVNSDLEKTIAPLMAKVERLQNVVELKDKELTQLRAIGIKQQEELKALQQNTASAPDYEEVITTFGEVGQSLGWHGWGRRGYRSEDGTLHTGINALAAFISDLAHSDNLCPEVAF